MMQNQIINVNSINSMCRVCLSNNNPSIQQISQEIDAKFMKININIEKSADKPSNICRQCLDKLTQCCEFIDALISNENALNDFIQKKQQQRQSTKKWVMKNKRYACKSCDKKYATKNDLCVHQRTHTGETPYACGVCARQFRDERNLRKHEKIHNRNNSQCFRCDYCDKSFLQRSTLREHVRVHTGEKPYMCPRCAFCCANLSYLSVHMRTHTNERPYKCDQCDASFASRTGLNHHAKRHTNERNFMCNVCGKAFKVEIDLKMHQKRHKND